jgi:hypothetical protein
LSVQRTGQRDHLADLGAGRESGDLQHRSDASSSNGFARGAPGHAHLPLMRALQADETVDRGRLPCAVRAEERDDGAALDGEIDA